MQVPASKTVDPMSLHSSSPGIPPPPYSTSTPLNSSRNLPLNTSRNLPLNASPNLPAANPAFGMVRLSPGSSPAEQFLIQHHQARLNNMYGTPGNNVSSSSSSSEDKSSGGETPMSRTNQYKKIMKPLLERKRRARINKCLDELKDIMTVALQAQGENVSKLEKADILELTVRHLHKLQQSQRLMPRNPLEEVQRFQAGYSSCAQEAASFLLQAPGVDVNVSQRLLAHLTSTSTLAMRNPFVNATPPNNNYAQSRSPLSDTPPSSGSLHSPRSGHTLFGSPEMGSVKSEPLSKSPEFSSPSPRPFHSPPLGHTHSSTSPPPRPSSNPEPTRATLGMFTVAITKAPVEGISDKEGTRMPVKPEAIRLNPNDPVWRPF